MARTYKRDRKGQFAGGGGGLSSVLGRSTKRSNTTRVATRVAGGKVGIGFGLRTSTRSVRNARARNNRANFTRLGVIS